MDFQSKAYGTVHKTYLKIEINPFDSSRIIDQADPATGVDLVSMLQHQALRHTEHTLILHDDPQLLPFLAVPSVQ